LVPADRAQQYQPGTYFRASELQEGGYYYYTVVVVDAYGQIAGVAFDRTETRSEFLTDPDGNLYVFVEGDKAAIPNSYRLVSATTKPSAYPLLTTAITRDDLVEGINNAAIAELTPVPAFETSRVLAEGVALDSKTLPTYLVDAANWVDQSEKIAFKIVEDQTTYGIQLLTTAGNVRAANVGNPATGVVLNNADVLTALVQGILDDDARLVSEDDLLDIDDAEKGLYPVKATGGRIYPGIGNRIFDETSWTNLDVLRGFGMTKRIQELELLHHLNGF